MEKPRANLALAHSKICRTFAGGYYSRAYIFLYIIWEGASSLKGNVPHVACNVWPNGNEHTLGRIPNEFTVQFTKHRPQIRRATRCKQRAVHCVCNENELLTHTLLARCGTFTLLPILTSTIEPAAAGCVETRSQSDRLKLETRERSDRLKLSRAATD